MRLKKIPYGSIRIKFTNPWTEIAHIYRNKNLWLIIPPNEYLLIRADNFSGNGLIYPEMQLYSNLKIGVEYE